MLIIFVLILPMRNGNIVATHTTKLSEHGSYPTYEEWKRFNRIFPF